VWVIVATAACVLKLIGGFMGIKAAMFLLMYVMVTRLYYLDILAYTSAPRRGLFAIMI